MKVAEDVLVKRITGRRVHLPSGRIYNVFYDPPKVEGKDDVTGEPLTQRADDTPETLEKRMASYNAVTKPILDIYR